MVTKTRIPLIPEGGVLNTPIDQEKYGEVMKKNNPKDEPVGDFTGRCARCGSKSLWDDNTAYGCKDCLWVRSTGELTPGKRVE